VQSRSNARVAYLSSEKFTNKYIDALQKGSLVDFRKKYRNIDVLLIDDIHFLSGKERLQEEFFHTFNSLFDNHKQIVLTSDRPASEIAGLEHRLVTRFMWGLVTELETPDVETRIAILRKKQEQLNLSLPDEAVLYIAEHIRSDIRRLEGALIRATSFTSLTGRDLSIQALESLLRDTLDQEKQEALTIERIQRTVADYYDIRLADMSSNRRPQSIAFPRQVAMYLCRTMTNYSLPAIGDAFARNHATVMHACKLITSCIQKDAEFRHTLSILDQKLSQRSGS
jgi:chromosomal replication initiator protein